MIFLVNAAGYGRAAEPLKNGRSTFFNEVTKPWNTRSKSGACFAEGTNAQGNSICRKKKQKI